MRKERGFTLIELMVTIAIAAILLSVAVPSFINLVVGSRLTTQANDLVAGVYAARSEAVKRNQNVSLCRAGSATATACAGAGVWEHWIVLAGVDTVVRRGVLHRYGSTIGTTSSLPGGELVFSPDGLARTTGGVLANGQTITVCAASGPPDNMRRLDIGAGSRISTTAVGGSCTW